MAPARNQSGSPLGRLLYNARYRAGEYVLRGLVAAIPVLPYRLLLGFASLMSHVTFWVLWNYRSRMERNVDLALAGTVPARSDRRRIVWRAWKNFGRGLLDTAMAMHVPPEKIAADVDIDGEEHLKQALARGKGVLALSAHLGAFTLIGARLAAAGYPFSVVVKHPRDERFARLIDSYRARVGIDTIAAKPRREAVRGILRALRQNRIVLVIADEFKSGGVSVEFLGQRAPAPRGPATLALRTGAPALPMFAIRRFDGSMLLCIGPEISPIRRDDVEESVAATTALFTRHLEQMVRAHPDQWNWLGFPRHRASRASLSLKNRADAKRPAAVSAVNPGSRSQA